jgi:hypothetical protein
MISAETVVLLQNAPTDFTEIEMKFHCVQSRLCFPEGAAAKQVQIVRIGCAPSRAAASLPFANWTLCVGNQPPNV